jgi:hypothetical protein
MKRVAVDPLRVSARLDALGTNAFAAAQRGGLERVYISDLLAGRKKTVRSALLPQLAVALECAPEFLTSEQDRVGEPPHDCSHLVREDRLPSTLQVSGMIEEGVFRTPEAEKFQTSVETGPDRRYLGMRQCAFLVSGSAYASEGIPEGSIVTGVNAEDFFARLSVQDGRYVIAQATVDGIAGRELFLRKIGTVDGAITLTAFGGAPEAATISIGADLSGSDGARKVEILAVVARVLQVI